MTDVDAVAPKGLDAILTSVIDTHYTEEPAAVAPPSDEPDEPVADDRPRDAQGRFVAKESTDEGAASDGATKPEPETAPVQQPEPAPQQFEPHPRWNEAQKAAFSALPPDAKKFALDVQAEHEANFTRKAQEAAEFKRSAEPLLQAVQPFQQYLAQVAPARGTTPHDMVRNILAAEYQLANGDTRQKYATFFGLAQHYGIDLAALASGQLPVQQQQHQAPQPDPAIQQRLDALEAAQQEHLALQAINSFVNAKDQSGQPKYPHYERVKAVMASFLGSGQAKTMEEAYTLAMEPLNGLLEQEKAAANAAAERERQAALEKAKRAAPVRTSTGSIPNGKTEAKGLDAHISRALEKAGIS